MITFRIVNPFDGSVIKENVTLVENYVAITVKDANGGVSGKTLLGAEEYTIQVQSVRAQVQLLGLQMRPLLRLLTSRLLLPSPSMGSQLMVSSSLSRLRSSAIRLRL
jgi:hypothetical protein